MLNRKSRFCIALLILALSVPVFTVAQPSNATSATDTKVLQNVGKMLAQHPSFKNVRPVVEDSIVTLQGSVDSYHNKLRLHDTVKGVQGVEGVRNQVQVSTEAIPDDQLAKMLAGKLRYDRIGQGIVFNNLTLQVNDGHVVLGGNVLNYTDRDSALSIVENAKGVTDVTDNIQVAPVSFFDDQLRLRLARAIYGSPVLQRYALDPEAPIRIVVQNGHVTLYGAVDNKLDRQVAYFQARSVPGVFSVDDKIAIPGDRMNMEQAR
ncbi:MAG TPA: BON domain-containing protein [Terriglobales bacterium]|jgi:hyperosmotically inducible protein|nr:BON domain-containing protein [Terriglobales bacterium]